MYFWDFRLIPVLPNKMLVSQWRECLAIKRQWEKGTLKHRLVSYVMNYDTSFFSNYVTLIAKEMNRRNIKFKVQYLNEIFEFSSNLNTVLFIPYPEHNDRYLKQCYYNLQEKYDRGIITEDEWKPIDKFWEYILASENGKL